MCTKCAPNVHRIQKSASFRSLLHSVLHRQSEQVGSVTICCGHHVRVGVKRRADLTMCPNQTTSEAIPEPYESPHSPATFHKPQQHRQEKALESNQPPRIISRASASVTPQAESSLTYICSILARLGSPKSKPDVSLTFLNIAALTQSLTPESLPPQADNTATVTEKVVISFFTFLEYNMKSKTLTMALNQRTPTRFLFWTNDPPRAPTLLYPRFKAQKTLWDIKDR